MMSHPHQNPKSLHVGQDGSTNVTGSSLTAAQRATLGVDEGDTFILRIINTISYKQTKLTVTKKYTINDVQQAYSPFEAHPEFYAWKDMFGKTLDPKKSLVQNGLVTRDEIVEFDGIGKEPCILLVFKDGFEDDTSVNLNPLHPRKDENNQGLCRNY